MKNARLILWFAVLALIALTLPRSTRVVAQSTVDNLTDEAAQLTGRNLQIAAKSIYIQGFDSTDERWCRNSQHSLALLQSNRILVQRYQGVSETQGMMAMLEAIVSSPPCSTLQLGPTMTVELGEREGDEADDVVIGTPSLGASGGVSGTGGCDVASGGGVVCMEVPALAVAYVFMPEASRELFLASLDAPTGDALRSWYAENYETASFIADEFTRIYETDLALPESYATYESPHAMIPFMRPQLAQEWLDTSPPAEMQLAPDSETLPQLEIAPDGVYLQLPIYENVQEYLQLDALENAPAEWLILGRFRQPVE